MLPHKTVSRQHSELHMQAVTNSILFRMNSLPDLKAEKGKQATPLIVDGKRKTAKEPGQPNTVPNIQVNRASSVKYQRTKHAVSFKLRLLLSTDQIMFVKKKFGKSLAGK